MVKFGTPTKATPSIEKFKPSELVENKEALDVYLALQKELDDAENIYYKKQGLEWKPRSKSFILARLQNFGNTVYMLKDNDEYVGCAQTVNCEEGVLNVASVVLFKSVRGKGFGKMIMDAVIEDTKGYTLRLNVNLVNPHAIELYKACGFFPTTYTMWRLKGTKK